LNKDWASLNLLKATLSFYFTLIQFDFDYTNMAAHSRRSKIDKRYISLASAFLQSTDSRIHIPENISFLTWNYDLQLELALETFLSHSNTQFSKTLEAFRSEPGVETSNSIPSILHLNGCASMIKFAKDEMINLFDCIRSDKFRDTISTLLPIYIRAIEADPANTELFSFAWEETDVAVRVKSRLIELAQQTEILVIIGYSFPAFNRKTDRLFFQHIPKMTLKKIYYQTLKPDADALASTFNLPVQRILPVDNTDQFFLPFEF
jgi:hypothetical protein